VVRVSILDRKKTIGRRGIAVFIGVAAAFTVFGLTAGLLYYRFLTIVQPDCSLVVTADSSYAGDVVIVSSPVMEPLQGTLSAADRFSIHFFLNAGAYDVQVVDKDGVTIYEAHPDLYPSFPRAIDLTRLKPQTSPS
jgi:hypothetical protein